MAGWQIAGGPDRRCSVGLLPLDKAEHPDPRLCPCDLTGKCCAAGVFPRNGWSFHPVYLDHGTGTVRSSLSSLNSMAFLILGALGPQRTITSLKDRR